MAREAITFYPHPGDTEKFREALAEEDKTMTGVLRRFVREYVAARASDSSTVGAQPNREDTP